MSKQYKPNIVRGGVAIPLGNNYFFMKGRKHKQGGIDVGKDLEVEDGEIMKVSPKEVKVFSAVPFLNGQSPVEKLLGGENPNKVFAEQERFKKVNKINDDGTKAQLGKGKKITTNEIPESQQYAVTTPDGQRKVFNSKQEASDYVTANTPKGYSLYDITNYGSNIDKGQTAILNRNTEREIEKATKQEELAKARLATRQQNKEASKEMLSYMPVIGDGMDLYQLGKDIYNKQYGNAAITAAALTMPAWADALVKPIGKAVKIGYNKFNNLFRKNNKLNEDDYVKNLNYIYSKYIRNQDLNSINDETWDYLYDKAIKENNLKEVQKLRALHFKQKAVGNKNNQLQYHGIANGYDPNFNIFNPQENHASVFTSNDLNTSTSYVDDFITSNEQKNAINKHINDAEQILLEEIENYHKRKNKGESVDPNYLALLETHLKHFYKNPETYKNRVINSAGYSPERVKRLYTYLENPIQFNNQGKRWNQIKLSYLPEDVVNKIPKDDITRQLYQLKTQNVEDLSRSMGYDGVIIDDMVDFGMSSEYKIIDANKPAQIVITNDPRKLKLADPITYDDKGKIIPLSKRDDFTNPDIRYSWLLPTIGATTGLSLLNNNNQNVKRFGGRTKAPLGILKKIGQSLGIIEEDKKTYTNDIHWGIKQNIKNGKIHIGGKPNEARQKYFDLDKEFSDSVKAVSKRYGLNPNLVASRIAKEGPIDYGIELVNDSVGFNREQMDGAFWGLDDLGTHLAEGRVTIKEPWNRIKSNRYFTNEKGRDTNSVYSTEWVDGIYGTAAELKYRRDYMKKHFPDMTDEQLDAAAAASFNRGNYGARKWINNKGNYMQYKPFIKLKQMGGNHNDKNGKWLQKNGKIVTIADKDRFADKHDIYPMSTKVIKDGDRKTIVNVPDTVSGPKILRPFVHVGRRMTNTANEMFKRNKKPMGGNHKLNTNQMANIYRVDSNGKTTWGMNFSTGDKSKSRQKAFYGIQQHKVNWSDPSSEDYRTMVTIDPIKMVYDPSVDETQYYGKDLPEVSVTRDVRIAPTNTSVDEMDVNRTITRKAKQPNKYYKPNIDPNIDYYAPTSDDYYFMFNGYRKNKNNVKAGPIFNNTVDIKDDNREIPKTYVSTKSNSSKSTTSKIRRKYWDNLSTYEDKPDNQVKSNKTNVVTPNTIKSTTNNKSVNYSVTNKKQTTPSTSATKTASKANVTNNTSNITTPNNVTRTAPIAKSTSQETPIFGLDAQNAFKKSIVGSKSNPDYIRGTFDFRDNKELVNKVDPNTIKVNPTNIRYKSAPSNGGYFKNYNAGDYISLGANVLGNIGSALINKHTLDNMEYASAPVPKMAIKQKTNFNINPQLDLSRERLRESVSDVNANTASSSTALNRNNKLRLANIMNTNQLYSTKENMETQLINADRMNQQNVFNSNIDAFNTWNKEKNIFETAKQEKYGENKVSAVQGISQAVHDFINNNEKRRQFNNSLISIIAANPNVNPEYLKTLGADWITDKHIRNWKLANNYKV